MKILSADLFYVTNNQPFRKELKKYCKINFENVWLFRVKNIPLHSQMKIVMHS